MTVAAEHDIKGWLAEAVKAEEINDKDFQKNGILFEAVVPKHHIVETAKEFLAQGYFLESLTAVDFAECFELVYHFNRWASPKRCVVKVVAEKAPSTQDASVPTISNVYPSANWFEREVCEFFGIRFEGHPNLKKLLLPDNYKDFPLRKSFKGEAKGSDVAQSLELIKEYAHEFDTKTPHSVTKAGDKDYYLNLGPQHPSTHGVLRVLLHLSGERVLDAEPIIGYSHRHHEKMMEIQNYLACWPNFGRLDYVGAMSFNFGYARLVERALGITPSPRVEYIRVLTTELNHISSHLLWMGTFLLDLGGFTPFFYAFDDREKILDILEMATGERLTYDYFRFGGLDRDIPAEMIPAVKKFIPAFRKKLKDYDALVTKNPIFEHRTRGVGLLTKENALKYGVTGPALRASGVGMDLRRQEPYSVYPEFDFKVPTATDGDVYSRYLVRVQEMHESLKILEQVCDRMPPTGEVKMKTPKNLPKGEYYSAVESARGLFGIYVVSDGTLNPYRIKLRTPSFSNLNSIIPMLPGCMVSDVIAVLGSIDIVLPEIDR